MNNTKGQGQGCGIGQGNNIPQHERVNAVLAKLEILENKMSAGIDEYMLNIKDTTATQISEINRKLFDNITKADLIASILDGDTLSLEGLLARDDVQRAIEATKELHAIGFQNAVAIGGTVQNLESTIMDRLHEIRLDVIIHGCTSSISLAIERVESAIKIELRKLAK